MEDEKKEHWFVQVYPFIDNDENKLQVKQRNFVFMK